MCIQLCCSTRRLINRHSQDVGPSRNTTLCIETSRLYFIFKYDAILQNISDYLLVSGFCELIFDTRWWHRKEIFIPAEISPQIQEELRTSFVEALVQCSISEENSLPEEEQHLDITSQASPDQTRWVELIFS